MENRPFDYDQRRVHQAELASLLPESHTYLAEAASFYRIGAKGSLSAKARTLRMPLERLAKTLYYEHPDGSLIATVIPASIQVDERLLYDAIGTASLHRATYLPQGMTRGTCGPFLSAEDIAKGTVEAILWDIDDLESIMDFAVPSQERITMQMSFGAALEMLKQRRHPLYHACLYDHSKTLIPAQELGVHDTVHYNPAGY